MDGDLQGQYQSHDGPSYGLGAASKFLFWPGFSLFWRGQTHDLTMKDLWRLTNQEATKTTYGRFEFHWKATVAKGNPSIWVPVFRTFGYDFLLAVAMSIVQAGTQFTIPLLLKHIILYLYLPTVPMWYGFVYFAAIFCSSICSAFFYHHNSYLIWRVGVRLRGALTTLIYRKALRLAPGTGNGNSGSTVNLMSTDSQIVLDSLVWFFQGLIAPIQFAVILGLLSMHIGSFALIPLGVLLLGVPVMGYTSRSIGPIRLATQNLTDIRIKLTTELIIAVRIVKYYAWERPFATNIDESRETELRQLRVFALSRAMLFLVLLGLTPLSLGLTIIGYAAKYDLGLESAFSAISYLTMLRLPFVFFPITITFIGQYIVSFRRIADFAMLPELPERQLSPDPRGRGGMSITNGNFSWPLRGTEVGSASPSGDSSSADSDSTHATSPSSAPVVDSDYVIDATTGARHKLILKDVSLDIPKGSLTIVVGGVGSGKSSLALAMLGEMPKVSGEVFVPQQIAYASQEAWIVNSTIRQNILFGQPYDFEWYQQVITSCCLVTDFEMLPGGDLTGLAERGANLSGGQRQRINIARAMYSRRELYILDDPFSAVDAQVGDMLFHNVVMNLKKANRTVLLVTNQLHFLPFADNVVVLRDGRISEQGDFGELMQNKGEFFKLAREQGLNKSGALSKSAGGIQQVHQKPKAASAISEKKARKRDEKNMAKGKLVEEEEMARGVVALSTYWNYISSSRKSLLIFLIAVVFNILRSASRVGGLIWISKWVNPSTFSKFSKGTHIGVYASLLAGEVSFGVLYTLVNAFFLLVSAREVHKRLLHNVLRATTRFFDTTPIGRLLARFSKDIYIIDNTLPNQLEMTVDVTFQLLSVFANLATGSPYAIIIIICVLVVLLGILFFFRRTACQVQRLEALTRAPVFTHFNESIEGVALVRSYGMTSAFEVALSNKIDRNNIAFLSLRRLSSWYLMTCEQVGSVGVAGIILLLVLARNYAPSAISVSLAANALGSAVGVVSLITAVNNNFSELENRMNSAERIAQYDHTEQEAAYEIPETAPGAAWPSAGGIDFDDLVIEYVPGVPVLKGINATIKPHEKIGIVGRTGAGKSTLITALFRTTEPSEGSVRIDGVDISTLGLFDLRKKLSIIPQVPQLFMGTVRYNLDPFAEHNDDALWRVLERVNLDAHVKSLPGGLDGAVEENGANFSVGQRQLLSMARCLLRDTHILLLDEATASLDVESDALLQRMIRTYFKDKSVITIAHRLVTVIDSDRIMVLDAGRVVEFDSPAKLLEKKGVLYSMVQATGPATAAHLISIAQGKFTVDQALLNQPDLIESSLVEELPL